MSSVNVHQAINVAAVGIKNCRVRFLSLGIWGRCVQILSPSHL